MRERKLDKEESECGRPWELKSRGRVCVCERGDIFVQYKLLLIFRSTVCLPFLYSLFIREVIDWVVKVIRFLTKNKDYTY